MKEIMEGEPAHNRLIDEKSPYLQQHARNPVDWHPWGPEAFEKAEREDKPIFLSIGYSTCHWCHVMAHESFEDSEVARALNSAFVNIKVDREERPDIDNVYMTACMIMTQGGGWPLTIVMTPDRRPFFAATYIPKRGRGGRPGMLELIPQISGLWASRRDEVDLTAEAMVVGIKQVSTPKTERTDGKELGVDDVRAAVEALTRRFDGDHGGFGRPPKFPSAHNLMLVLRQWRRAGDGEALRMVRKTLDAMRRGGIHDHVGFGFHRYATDERWLLPHFEKMLYDQAMMAMAYLEGYQATGDASYARTAREVFDYVTRDMTSPEGGFYSAEDADSEGEEGKFYVWTEEEMKEVLGENAGLAGRTFNTADGGNFKDEATGKRTGANILHLTLSLEELAEKEGLAEKDLAIRLEDIRRRLFEARRRRVHPLKDDKVLTDWNGLMMAALAMGGRVLADEKYTGAARKAAAFVRGNMRGPAGGLLHRYRDGEAEIPGFADDYAFYVWGLLELYATTMDPQYLGEALETTDHFLDHFCDEDGEACFFTPDDGEELIVRRKESHDGAIPSGNSVMMMNLLRLGALSGRDDLRSRGERLGASLSDEARAHRLGHAHLMNAVDLRLGPEVLVVLCGEPGDEEVRGMASAVWSSFYPTASVILRPPGGAVQELSWLDGLLKDAGEDAVPGTATIVVDREVRATLDDAEKLEKSLGELNPPSSE